VTFFCIAWDAFLVRWYWTALADPTHSRALFALVFPIGHVAVGVVLTYYTLALYLNRTTIRLDHREAIVEHRPLPWRGARRASLEGLRSVYYREVVGSGRKKRSRWEVLLDTDDNAATRLVTWLPSADDARFVAAQIAEHARVRLR
jgi:hypothetical protein